MPPERSTSAKVLLVDDNRAALEAMQAILRAQTDLVVYCLEDARLALPTAQEFRPDAVILDVHMPCLSGPQVCRQLKQSPELCHIPVLFLTAVGSDAHFRARCLEEGGDDFLEKPVSSEELIARLRVRLRIKARQDALRRERDDLERKVQERAREREDRLQESRASCFLGNSPAILRVRQMVERVAASDAAVLICGESGTGKELVAEMIHRQSRRKDHPLVVVNCGALPETLQESELFGHVKGAFTGAHKDKRGLLTEAEGGTLFLDEVAELSPAAQVKLLRFLENGECRRVGDTSTEKLNVRILAATNRDLARDVKAGQFRSDLYYRLNVIPIHVPPLREIKEDIPLMARVFLEEFSSRLSQKPPRISQECLRLLMEHSWPGNVRELRNLAERAVVVDRDGLVTLTDLPDSFQTPRSAVLGTALKGRLTLKELEKQYILATLEECGGSRKKTGQVLGITKATLWRKLKSYGAMPTGCASDSYVTTEEIEFDGSQLLEV